MIVQRTFVDESKPQQIADRILATNGHALIIYGQENAAVIDAVTQVTAAGIPVVALVSDLPTSPRLAYVGVDHYGTGRTAAFFMARMAPRKGPVIVLCHSFGYRAHAQRVSGFRDGIAQYGPDLAIASILEGHDEQIRSEQLVTEALGAVPDAVGVYNTGGANRAVEAALRARGLARKIIFIGHELTVNTRRMLAEGVMTLTIDQNPEQQARVAIDVLAPPLRLCRRPGPAWRGALYHPWAGKPPVGRRPWPLLTPAGQQEPADRCRASGGSRYTSSATRRTT